MSVADSSFVRRAATFPCVIERDADEEEDEDDPDEGVVGWNIEHAVSLLWISSPSLKRNDRAMYHFSADLSSIWRGKIAGLR